MTEQVIYTDKYRWRIGLYYVEDCSDTAESVEILSTAGCRGSKLIAAARNLTGCEYNTAVTYSNAGRRNSTVIIGKTDSDGETVNSLAHELDHVAEHVAKTDGLTAEDRACIVGDLAEAIYRSWNDRKRR